MAAKGGHGFQYLNIITVLLSSLLIFDSANADWYG